MTDRELLQQALDALQGNWRTDESDKAIEALRARLSQCDRCGEVNPAEIHTCTPKQQEPAAWTVRGLITNFSRDFSAYKTKTYTVPLYTAPPQREWVGLTDEEIEEAGKNNVEGERMLPYAFARTIEQALKEKNI